MLQLPQFLQQLMEKFKTIRDKTDSLGGLAGMMGGVSSPGTDGPEAVVGPDRLSEFQKSMTRLEEVFSCQIFHHLS